MANKIERPGTAKITDRITPTIAEKLFLWRRKNKLTQAKAAKQIGVSTFAYKLMEYGKTELSPETVAKLSQVTKPHEFCIIYRRRCRVSQEEVAKELGICRNWMRLKETGKIPCEDLLAYWEC